MGIIPKKTCPNCGEEYSALSPRCPKCGERSVKQSSRAANTTASAVHGSAAGTRAEKNAQYQLIFGGAIILLVIFAVIILIVVSLSGGGGSTVDKKKDKNPPPTEAPVAETMVIATPEPTPIPTPEVTPTVNSITINYGQNKMTDFTIRSGEAPVTLTAAVYPTDIDAAANCKWTVEDSSIASIEVSGTTCKVSWAGPGMTKVILTCFGGTAECVVHCPG